MLDQITPFIIQYGYLAIFVIIVLQEIGLPVPMPNEILLMFCGFLAFTGKFDLFPAILVTFAASMTGAWILYGAFYGLGTLIHPRLHSVLQIIIKEASDKLERHHIWLFIGRILPFGRGYICIAAGLAKVNPLRFLIVTIIADTFWNAGFVLLGFFTGNYWDAVSKKVGGVVHLLSGIVLLFAAYQLAKFATKKWYKNKKSY